MYITIDGGTTNTRIYTVENNNVKLLDKAAAGIHNPGGLRSFLKKNLDCIGKTNIDAIIASGMITSGKGLYEIEHIKAPAGLYELHSAMQKTVLQDITDVPFTFIPGVKIESEHINNADVMRGEETELMGLGKIKENAAYILPGTHSKCIMTDSKGRICDFFTMLTGEMLYALKNDTIIGTSFEYFDSTDNKYLFYGYEFAAENGINEALFKCRTMDILYKKSKKEIYSFCLGAVLSGEIARIAKVNAQVFVLGGKRVLRVPESLLLKKYFGKNVICLDDDVCDKAAAIGAVKIYEYGF